MGMIPLGAYSESCNEISNNYFKQENGIFERFKTDSVTEKAGYQIQWTP